MGRAPRIADKEAEDVNNAVLTDLKSAAITAAVSSASVFLAVKHIPWARTNLNHTGRTLIVCGDQAIVETQRKNTRYK